MLALSGSLGRLFWSLDYFQLPIFLSSRGPVRCREKTGRDFCLPGCSGTCAASECFQEAAELLSTWGWPVDGVPSGSGHTRGKGPSMLSLWALLWGAVGPGGYWCSKLSKLCWVCSNTRSEQGYFTSQLLVEGGLRLSFIIVLWEMLRPFLGGSYQDLSCWWSVW